MNYDIVKPQQGKVTLELDMDEAEILTRLVGRANSGNLKAMAPALFDFVQDMVEIVGRDGKEAKTYRTSTFGSQVFVDSKEDVS